MYRLLGSILLVWIGATILLWPYHGALLNWDEVDYVNAARLGIWANATEQKSLTPLEFAQMSKAKASGAVYLPPNYDENVDPFLLRHFHPPFVVYLESAILKVWGHPSERTLRSLNLAGALALIAALFFSYRSLSDKISWKGMSVLALAALPICQLGFSSLQFHGWLAVWVVAISIFLWRWLEKPKISSGVLTCIGLALAALTLETGAIVLVGAVITAVLWKPHQLKYSTSFWLTLGVGILLTIVLVSLAWPGALIKLSPLKTLATYFYRIYLGKEYSQINYRLIIATLGPMLILIPAVCIWLFYFDFKRSRRWGSFFVIGTLYGLATIKFAIGVNYFVPALAPFAVLIGLSAERIKSTLGRISITAALAVMLGPLVFAAYQQARQEDPLRADLSWLREDLRDREALMDGAHIFRYYLGSDYRIRPIFPSYDGELLQRNEGKYSPLGISDVNGSVVVIMIRGSNESKPAERELLRGCSRKDGMVVRVYDCRK